MKTISITAPSLDEMQAMAESHMANVAPELAVHVKDVVVRVADFPEESIFEEMELETPFDLLGLYIGTAKPNKSVLDAPQHVDMVFLYRRAILDYWCETGEDLSAIVRHVLLHEIGHHFGFSDADMDRIENRAP